MKNILSFIPTTGLMDQTAALDWISKNIMHFNGNPKSITLMGHGAGAVSALLHLTSGDWSSDKFQKLIVMSGTPMDSTFVRDPKYFKPAIKEVGGVFGCEWQISSKILQCLRNLPDSHIMANLPMFDWSPVIDLNLSNSTSPFIPENPKEMFEKQGFMRKIPIMIGFTDMEQILDMTMSEMLENGLSNEMYVSLTTDSILKDMEELGMNNETTCGDSGSGLNNQPLIDAMTFAYMPYFTSDQKQIRKKFIDFNTEKLYIAPSFSIAKALSKNSDVFMYRFDTKPKTQTIIDMLPDWSGVPHRFDQIFVWGMPYWVSLSNQTQWSTEDKRLSDIIMTMWANFAKYSNPTERGVYIRWNKFTEESPGVLIIDRSFSMSDPMTLNYQGVQFWNDYANKVIDFSMQCCNATSLGTTTEISLFSITSFILSNFFIGTVSNGFQ